VTPIHALICSGNQKLGGFIGLSSWLPLQDDMKKMKESENPGSNTLQQIADMTNPASSTNNSTPDTKSIYETPIFPSHCKDDEAISIQMGTTSIKT